MNKIIVSGNLANVVTKKHLNNGMCVANSTLAINTNIKKQNGSKETEVCYIDITAYGKTAEVLNQYTTKGTRLLIEGKLKQDIWQDSNGATKSKHYVIVERLEFLNRKAQQSNNTNQQPTQNAYIAQQQPYQTQYQQNNAPYQQNNNPYPPQNHNIRN
ncbi:MAG: single-stranded DNA-binding protein [Helicobacter sp.]|uniref:single-stranded DNA-binding protein n=1 Tax=Helicobacter sp. TaxID=218 RepID=UPI002A9194C6|nr:single-stranded DNA-binding protein [Helicobacter sp.]MDY5951511.1 single-stranded DNA-binding protein [Helicobacter sp.]